MDNVTALFGSRPTSLYDKGYDSAGFDVATVPLMYFNDDGEWHSSSKVAVSLIDSVVQSLNFGSAIILSLTHLF